MRKLMGYLPYILGIIIIALIVLLIIVSNGDGDKVNTNDNTNTVSDKELTVADNTDTNTNASASNNKDGNTDSKKNENKDKDVDTDPEITDTPDANPTPTEIPAVSGEGNEFGLKFDDKQDFVTIKAGSRIRAGASTETDIIKELSAETKLERTGYNDSWTRVIYDGMECYVSTSLVISASTDASATPVPTKAPEDAKPTEAPKNNGTYEAKNDYVEIKAGSRIRAEASTDCEIVTTLDGDLIVERTGYSSDWTRIMYNGKECYVSTPLVKRTCDKYGTTVDENGNPEKTDDGNTGDNKSDNDGNTGDNDGNSENNDPNGGNNGDGNADGGNDEPVPPVTEFKEKNDYVEIKAGARIRSSATTDSDDNIVTTTAAVSRLRRTGSGSGWARVEYDGQTCYISNSVINCSMTEEQARAADEADRQAAEDNAGGDNTEE